ncbi:MULTISPECIES: phosphorylase [unclassified Nitrosospira]|uniref:phosphorylase family protein n=1 Tax=unclassified Nitrosospira TaxID=2609267 RepID=UPI000D30C359|nr:MULTISPECIES: phosphorylase [unclassified Nitrosospira]WON75041.1 phosphorylase [Nitrosospira sp. Is2]
MRGVGIVTAMRVEARCITRRRLPFNAPIGLGENGAIWLSGMGADAARKAAEGLRTSGATALMSFGFAGALEPGLNPGDLVLPEFIHAGRLLEVDLSWRESLRQRLPGHLSITGGILAASPNVLTSGTAKRELARATGACAVDMESGAVAEAAAYAGIPFLAIRAISDPVEFSPPPVLLGAVRPDGRADLARLLPLLLGRALTVGMLLRLAADSRAACTTLSNVARFAGMQMGIASQRSSSSLASF